MLINIAYAGTKENGETYDASGQYDTEKNELKINTKSRWAPSVTQEDKEAKRWIEKIRQELVSKGFVDQATGVFKKDYIHSVNKKSGTPITTAAGLICGTARKADSCWKTIDDPVEQLFDRLERMGVVGKSGKGGKRCWIEPGKRKSLFNNVKIEPSFTEEWEQLNSENASQETSINFNEKISGEVEQEGFLHQNVIFYGVPGCGKSHRINELLHLDDQVNGLKKEYYKRILFHPEYSYSDFVGQLRPEVGDDNKITYKFVPGPFTEILRDAYKDQGNNYFLIIEEINRGNAPAIFGDLFQLLDRKDGVSEYSIDNKDILDYFERELEIARESKKDDISAMAQAVEAIKKDGIRIPANLTIFATMNTCDQNVFTLDTAFKRRWRMSRIKNKFDSILSTWKIHFENGKDVSWKDFAEKVNDAILKNCSDGTEAEDKQLGAFFVKEDDVKNVQRFAEKVLLYLWDDVAKYDQSQLFDKNKYRTLDEVIDAFVKGENVFSPNCAELQKLYEKIEQSGQAGDSSETEPSTDSLAQNAPEATGEEQGRE